MSIKAGVYASMVQCYPLSLLITRQFFSETKSRSTIGLCLVRQSSGQDIRYQWLTEGGLDVGKSSLRGSIALTWTSPSE